MYESFFGLKHAPFRITPDTQTFFGGGQREELLNALLYTIDRGEGMVKVVGEVGSGKTTLLRKLANVLPQRNVRLVYINSPNMPPRDILLYICHELGLTGDAQEPKFRIIERLQSHLMKVFAASERVVLLIDEAQSMPVETLEELRLLSNLETDTEKLLQMVLFGQPELDRLFENPEIRQIKDRIAFELQIEPFSMEELAGYLNFRVRAAGFIGSDLFGRAVVREIYRHTGGFPRRVNLLADKIMLAAYSAGSRVLNRALVAAALGTQPSRISPRFLLLASALVVLVVGIIGGGYYVKTRFAVESTSAVAPAPVEPVVATPVVDVVEPPAVVDIWPRLNQQLLQWTRQSQASGAIYTLQLMSVRQQDALEITERYGAGDVGFALRAYGYQQGKKQLAVVLTGEYRTPEAARAAVSGLPTDIITRYRPFVRTLADVQTELEQRMADRQTQF